MQHLSLEQDAIQNDVEQEKIYFRT